MENKYFLTPERATEMGYHETTEMAFSQMFYSLKNTLEQVGETEARELAVFLDNHPLYWWKSKDGQSATAVPS